MNERDLEKSQQKYENQQKTTPIITLEKQHHYIEQVMYYLQ